MSGMVLRSSQASIIPETSVLAAVEWSSGPCTVTFAQVQGRAKHLPGVLHHSWASFKSHARFPHFQALVRSLQSVRCLEINAYFWSYKDGEGPL